MSTQAELEAALLDDPQDIQRWLVYADWLQVQGDPRGELMQVQLALEDESRSVQERKAIREKEETLLNAHAETFLGPFAERFLQAPARAWMPRPTYRFEKGMLHQITFTELSTEDIEILKTWPQLPFLKELRVFGEEDEGVLGELVNVDLSHITHFVSGEPGESSFADGAAVHRLVARMPSLEVLQTYSHQVQTQEIFSEQLPRLRVLTVHHIHHYPLDVLAQNPAMAQLEELDLVPHALELVEEEQSYLDLRSIQAITGESSRLTNLQTLRLRQCSAGDAGIRSLVGWSGFSRLRVLDLVYGEVTDEGASLLANAGLVHLKRLDLSGNSLTEVGVRRLKQTGVHLVANGQTQWGDDREYLYFGDME